MTHLIKAGKHEDTNALSSKFFLSKDKIGAYVMFHENCQYVLPDRNGEVQQNDVNKLLGFSFGLFAVHKNSARFGWRWSVSDQCIELLAYVYHNGVKNWDAQLRYPVVAQIKPGQRVYVGILRNIYGYYFEVSLGHETIGFEHVAADLKKIPKYGTTHSLYFGGDNPAPHDMNVDIDLM